MAHVTFIEAQNDVSDRYVESNANRNIYGSYFQGAIRDKQRVTLLIFLLLFALIVPITFYFITTHLTFIPYIEHSCSVDTPYRITCGERNISEERCDNINCCYDNFKSQCYHFVPSKYNYYRNDVSNEYENLQPNTRFLNTIAKMQISTKEVDDQRLQIILHPENVKYANQKVANKNYYSENDARVLGIKVFRNSTNEMILTSFRGPLIASLHYWEWTVHLFTDKLFGLGEMAYNENAIITKIIYKNKNDHNTLPNFLCTLNGLYYGVRFEHEGPLEVTVLPSKIVIIKSLAGNKIAINVYMGPTPKDVVAQQKLEKLKSNPIPYWALGVHICRDGKTNPDSAIQEYLEFHRNQTSLQFASDCIHEDLYIMLHEMNETQNLKGIVENLREKMHFIMTVPPQIPKLNQQLYNAAVSFDMLYKTNNGEYWSGSYHKSAVVFPTFNHPSIGKWMENLKNSLSTLSIDGFVLKDNWPEEEGYVFEDNQHQFPYMTQDLNVSLSGTIPWDALAFNTEQHILNHNLYGKFQTTAYHENMQYQLLLMSSYDHEISDPALIQNVDISWSSLKKALVTTLFNSILGNPLVCLPVCGSTNNYNVKINDDVCLRWYIMTSTFPLFRISSEFPRRDPSQLATGYSKHSAIDALKKRHELLPYYYATLHSGEPLVRPMFYNFHSENDTWDLDEQYMVGDCLLVAQLMLPDLTHLKIYLPRSVRVWYEFWGGNIYKDRQWLNFNVVKNDWVMFIAEGCIVPLRKFAGTKIGEYTPNDSYRFVVALNCTTEKCFSNGLLRLDTIKLVLTANETGINMENIIEVKKVIGCDLAQPLYPRYVQGVNVFGLDNKIINSNFSTVDLCNIHEDSIFTSYFTMSQR